MNFLELSKFIDDESITKIEFTDDGFIIDFSKQLIKKDNLYNSNSIRSGNDCGDLTEAKLRRLYGVRLSKTGVSHHFNINNYINYTQINYNATLQCSDVINLSCVINIIRSVVNKNKLSFRYKLIIGNNISITEIDLYISKFDKLISLINEIEFQSKMVTINNINQLVADHGFNFTMIYE